LDSHTLVTTRMALHSLAEHVLAADLWHRTGKIGLRRTPGGFGQPEVVDDGVRHRLRVDGSHLVVLDDDAERWVELTSLAAAADVAATELGAPTEVFTPATPLHPHETLRIDAEAATVLADWFGFVDVILEEVRRRHRARTPTIVQLWPEHFDLAFSMSRVNVGGSPGDADHPEPYLYVGPWAPVEGGAWNEEWGLSIPASAVRDEDAAVDQIEHGLQAGFAGAP
jgi:hypothetical protein